MRVRALDSRLRKLKYISLWSSVWKDQNIVKDNASKWTWDNANTNSLKVLFYPLDKYMPTHVFCKMDFFPQTYPP